jgi:hypothetical protein
LGITSESVVEGKSIKRKFIGHWMTLNNLKNS